MEQGTVGKRQPRRAGQRPDELLPGEDSGPRTGGGSAIGTAAGGLAAGGLGGTTTETGIPEGEDLENAMASGRSDQSGDGDDPLEPQSGHAGGAVGGTPVFKRVARQ